MIPKLTRSELDELRAVIADKTLPAPYRAELTDWLDRREELFRARREARDELRSRRTAIRTVEIEVRDRVIAAAAARMTTHSLRTVSSDLDKAHRAVTDAERLRVTIDKATEAVESHLCHRLPIEHLPELVIWVAKQRSEHAWSSAPTGTISTVWASIAGSVSVELPLDAWETEPGVFAPQRLRLMLDLRGAGRSMTERIRFAWEAIAAGNYERTGIGLYKVTAAWSTRSIEPLPTTPEPRRRPFGLAST